MIQKPIVIVFVISLILSSCTSSKNPLVIGHRGARGHIAENTLPSIAKALELGVDGIEIVGQYTEQTEEETSPILYNNDS